MYLATSFLLCNEMKESFASPINCLNNDQQIDKKCGFTSSNPDYEMLMPVIFNLKHGIELFLKAFLMKTNLKQEYPTSHDLLILLNFLISNIINNKPKEKKVIEILNKDIREIIEKYYYGLYAFSKYKINPDTNNEAERYPEYRNCNCYKIDNLFDLNYNELLEMIKKDIQYIQKFFREEIYKKVC